jgi:hypothetical protein
MPTNIGPRVAPTGNKVLIRPWETATSLGARRISIGIVANITGTPMARKPAANIINIEIKVELITNREKYIPGSRIPGMYTNGLLMPMVCDSGPEERDPNMPPAGKAAINMPTVDREILRCSIAYVG